MEKRILGRTGMEVTALGLGCYQITSHFGGTYESAAEILDYAAQAGINYFDTAPMYGYGESEELIGRALRRHPDKRIYVGDKAGFYVQWEGEVLGQEKNVPAKFTDRAALIHAMKQSLWLLQRDHFDLLSIHEFNQPQWQIDYDTGDSVILEVLEDLKKEGLVANIGIGGWDLHLAARLIATGRIDAAMVPGGMSLLDRPICDEVLPAARQQNAGIILGGAFGQGNPFLLSKNRAGVRKYLLESEDERRVVTGRQLMKLYDLADELDVSMFEMALRYVLAFPEIHCHAAGARAVEHLRANVAAVEKGPLARDAVEAIHAIQREMENGIPSSEFSIIFLQVTGQGQLVKDAEKDL